MEGKIDVEATLSQEKGRWAITITGPSEVIDSIWDARGPFVRHFRQLDAEEDTENTTWLPPQGQKAIQLVQVPYTGPAEEMIARAPSLTLPYREVDGGEHFLRTAGLEIEIPPEYIKQDEPGFTRAAEGLEEPAGGLDA